MGDTTKFEQMFRRFVKSFIEAEKLQQEAARQEAEALEAAQRAFKASPQTSNQNPDNGDVVHIHIHKN